MKRFNWWGKHIQLSITTHTAMPIVYEDHARLGSIYLCREGRCYCVALELNEPNLQLSSPRSWHSGFYPFWNRTGMSMFQLLLSTPSLTSFSLRSHHDISRLTSSDLFTSYLAAHHHWPHCWRAIGFGSRRMDECLI